MGTQQLLMIVLVAIIVAVAVSLAVTYFKSHEQETDINEAINEMNHIAASAQGWYRKPSEMTGGGGSFTGFTFRSIAEPDSSEIAKYQIVSASGRLLQMKAVGYENFTITVNVYPDSIGSYTVVR